MIMERKSWEGARQACVDKQALSQVPLEAFRSVVTNIKYVIVYLIVLGSCYNVINERKSWAGARQACVDKEAALVSVQSREENDFLYGLLQKNTLKTFRY